MQKIIYIINGPNLNLLGKREPEIYGDTTLEEIEEISKNAGKRYKININFIQSNDEGQIVDWIQEAGIKSNGLIINAAGYTHTSIAIMDALLSINVPIIELHLSNIYKREDFRHHSYLSRAVKGVICGFGPYGYIMSINAISNIIDN